MRGCRPLQLWELKKAAKSFEGINKTRNKVFLVVGCSTGFRCSELLSLKLSDVYEDGCIKDQVTVARKNMKGKRSSRTMALNERARSSLRELVKYYKSRGMLDPGLFLFKSRKGENKPISRIQAWSILKRVFKKCKLAGKVAVHSLRKTFAQMLGEKTNWNIFLIQKALGHSGPGVTQMYLSFRDQIVFDYVLQL